MTEPDILSKPRGSIFENPRCDLCGVRAQLDNHHLCQQCKDRKR